MNTNKQLKIVFIVGCGVFFLGVLFCLFLFITPPLSAKMITWPVKILRLVVLLLVVGFGVYLYYDVYQKNLRHQSFWKKWLKKIKIKI